MVLERGPHRFQINLLWSSVQVFGYRDSPYLKPEMTFEFAADCTLAPLPLGEGMRRGSKRRTP